MTDGGAMTDTADHNQSAGNWTCQRCAKAHPTHRQPDNGLTIFDHVDGRGRQCPGGGKPPLEQMEFGKQPR
jgi:hypothetical protein